MSNEELPLPTDTPRPWRLGVLEDSRPACGLCGFGRLSYILKGSGCLIRNCRSLKTPLGLGGLESWKIRGFEALRLVDCMDLQD